MTTGNAQIIDQALGRIVAGYVKRSARPWNWSRTPTR